MGLLERLKKRWIVRRYLQVGALLVARYGPEPDYSPARVRVTLEKAKLSLRYLEHACAMFSSRTDFVSWMERLDRERADAGSIRAGSDPYRSITGTPPFEPRPRAHWEAFYDQLREDVAENFNAGSYRFLPDTGRDYDTFQAVSNEYTAGMKAPL